MTDTHALAPPARVAVIGAGPAGLMAAETISAAGIPVTVYDGSPSVGRKFLLAGRGGLNITHSEPLDRFIQRYHGGDAGANDRLAAWLTQFGPQEVRQWCAGLGIETFIGSSGRVFPNVLKGAPLLRAWLARLQAQGVQFRMKHRWVGWTADQRPDIRDESGQAVDTGAVSAWVLGLGGGSWPRMGSNGAWVPLLRERGVEVHDLKPSNCGFEVSVPLPNGQWRQGWSEHLRKQFAGAALKNVAATVQSHDPFTQSDSWTRRGEFVLTDYGIEGNLVYAATSRLREEMERDEQGHATLWLHLLPAVPEERIFAEVTRSRGARSWSTHLKSRLGLDGVKLALLNELLPKAQWEQPTAVARAIVQLPLNLSHMRPITEAISTSGGVAMAALDEGLQLVSLPGTWCVGEMLDWDAPTGGYLLTACLASGRHAGQALVQSLGYGKLSAF